MNKYDERYDIRLARKEEVPQVMKFLGENWDKNHILAHDRVLFEWQYESSTNPELVNAVIAVDRSLGTVEGFVGFIDCSKTTEPKCRDIFGALWCVGKRHENIPFLGVELVKRIKELRPYRTYSGSSLNPKTGAVLMKQMFKHHVVRMKHYYLLNENCKDFRIASIVHRNAPDATIRDMGNYVVEEIDINRPLEDMFDFNGNSNIPHKDAWYVKHRFMKHPYYRYIMWGIREQNSSVYDGILVMRSVEARNTCALRIVDYMGNYALFPYFHNDLQEIMLENGYEYVDFYFLGMGEMIVRNAGFVERLENDVNIIPNYFEPFLQKNGEVLVHYRDERIALFKADGDQDRPNMIL